MDRGIRSVICPNLVCVKGGTTVGGCEFCVRVFQFDQELERIGKVSFTLKERRRLRTLALATVRRIPETRCELVRSLLMLYVFERY
jgi:hypothetical protein